MFHKEKDTVMPVLFLLVGVLALALGIRLMIREDLSGGLLGFLIAAALFVLAYYASCKKK